MAAIPAESLLLRTQAEDCDQVMENGHPPLVLDDGTSDVEGMLIEPQDEHLSMDSVICFNEKIPMNVMSMEDVWRSSGGTDIVIATKEAKDILDGEVLKAMPSEVEVGYFRVENDLCSMGEEYLLGVEFAESITNSDCSSSEGLHASVSDGLVQVSTAGSDTGCRSCCFKTDNLQECQIVPINVGSSKLSDTPCLDCETLSGENPTVSPRSCTLQNSVKSQNSSSSSFEDILSDENGGRFSHVGEIFCSPKTIRNSDNELTVQNGATRVIKVEETLTTSAHASGTGVLPTHKRSRKPTQRYICELVDPILTYPKKKRRVSSSTIKDKSLGAKVQKRCQIMGAKAIRESPEEFSVIAIQVPFGSLANKECSEGPVRDMVPRADCRNSMTKSKGKCVALLSQNRMEKCSSISVDLMKRGDCGMGQKKTGSCVREAQVKKRYGDAIATNQKKRNECGISVIRKKGDECLVMEEDCSAVAHEKMRDDSLTCEEIRGRRKHHRLWTICEVRKLVDGVSQYGVGRWSRIKKLFFPASAHRTSVDLKDKWRNLLKASGMQQEGEKKRNVAWRPLPKSILSRVCELAAMHPYPKGRGQSGNDSSPEITLSDYRRVLRSINGN